jgi:hypothetical protein
MVQKIVLVCFLFLFSCIVHADDKPALIVLTDIGGDPDDTQSLRRLLVYSNEFRIKGLIATADNIPRPGYKHQIRTDLILDAIDDYSKVRDNLLLHASDYPTPESLRAVVRGGQVNRGAENLAPGKETPGSRHIIETVDSCTETIYIVMWGGAHDLAQALLDLKSTRSEKEVGKFIRKLRVYAVSDQDAINNIHPKGTGEWIRENFPDIWYVEPGSMSIEGMTASYRGMYQNDSKGGEHALKPLVMKGIEKLNDEAWVMENVVAWGPLGLGYPATVNQNPASERNTKGVKEGDTPSWFFVYHHGLNNPDFPEWGGWGGRFVNKSKNYYVEAEDNHWSGSSDASLRRKWTVARWREAYQNDFAARMRWCLLPFEEANHNPLVIVNGNDEKLPIEIYARVGDKLGFDASQSTDPDRNELSFNWFFYDEISDAKSVGIKTKSGSSKCSIEIPKGMEGRDIHLVLEITDNGIPSLTSYKRMVIHVK